MPFTQSDLDAINAAIKTGTIASLTFEGRAVQYRSVSDLEKIKAIIERELSAATGTRRFSLAGFTRQS